MEKSSQGAGGAQPDPWSGWQGQAHPNSPNGGGGPGRFKSLGSLGDSTGSWHGAPHPLAPAARYLAVNEAYAGIGTTTHVAVDERDGVYYVSLSASAAMRTFLRTQTEPFESTVKRMAAKSHLAVVVNGNMYGDAIDYKILRQIIGTAGLPIPSQDAKNTTPQGIVRGRDHELGGSSRKAMFYIAWTEGPLGGYAFGQGDPPTDTTSALGGLGPVIINGLRYGSQNRYRTGVPDGAPSRGEPDQKYKGFLEVRSSKTYSSFVSSGPDVGKVIIGYGSGERPLRIVVQSNGISDHSLDDIRDNLFNDGVTNAVFLDGSDSAMLFANGKFYVHQGGYKDRSNTVGIGFQLPFSHLGPSGKSAFC